MYIYNSILRNKIVYYVIKDTTERSRRHRTENRMS